MIDRRLPVSVRNQHVLPKSTYGVEDATRPVYDKTGICLKSPEKNSLSAAPTYTERISHVDRSTEKAEEQQTMRDKWDEWQIRSSGV